MCVLWGGATTCNCLFAALTLRSILEESMALVDGRPALEVADDEDGAAIIQPYVTREVPSVT